MQDKKEHRAECLGMIKQWQQSGLTQKGFCSANNIAYHVFHYWYGVYRSQQNATDSFLPVNIVPTASQEQFILTGPSGIQVKVAFTNQSVRFIQQLLLSS